MSRPLSRPSLSTSRGFTLIEICLATAMGAMLLMSLSHVARLATDSEAELRRVSDPQAQAAFVAQRLRAAARNATIQKTLMQDTSGHTGQWLEPLRFCTNTKGALVETASTDLLCTSGEVIADAVTSLTVAAPSNQAALDAPSVEITVVLPRPDSSSGTTITQTVRLKGLQE